jgi:23S rRNA (uracil1939-C5)-methyltransferase
MVNYFKPAVKAKSPAINQRATVTIDKLDMNGEGVARWNNKPLFVTAALPKEVVDVKVTEQRNKFARAKLISIKKRSDLRVEPQCHHFAQCGGCDLQMLSSSAQLDFKKQKVTELFSRSLHAHYHKEQSTALVLPWQPPINSAAWHYRRKARIGVQFNKKAQATIGFRQKSTNQLVAIKSCSVLVEPFNTIFSKLNNVLAQLTVKAAIGHIEVIEADNIVKAVPLQISEKKLAVLIIRQLKAMSLDDKTLWLSYAEKYNWHILVDDGHQQQPLNKTKADAKPAFTYTLDDDTTIYFSANDFIQINHQVNKTMVNQALTWLNVSPSDHILDLFCGLGNFSLSLAKHCASVVGVEGVQVMVDKAASNAKVNGINNCQFFQADLNSPWKPKLWANSKVFDKVVLDPARAGAEQAVYQIAALNIPTVLYISCDSATLARDSAVLLSKGYTLDKISLMDMFPQTKHVETMVLFTLHT